MQKRVTDYFWCNSTYLLSRMNTLSTSTPTENKWNKVGANDRCENTNRQKLYPYLSKVEETSVAMRSLREVADIKNENSVNEFKGCEWESVTRTYFSLKKKQLQLLA